MKDLIIKTEKVNWKSLVPFQPDDLKKTSPKTCTICEKVFPQENLSEYFYKWKGQWNPRCRICDSEYKRLWKTGNVKHYKRRSDYYKENRESMLENSRIWKSNNKERIQLYSKNTYEINKDKLKEKREKVKFNWLVILKRALDGRMRMLYKSKRMSKLSRSKRIFKYIGGSYKEWKLHLEKLFIKDMAWGNYGTYWVIDHIKPLLSFDFQNEEIAESELYKCFHYTNTQPLTREDHKVKTREERRRK